jgi:hypothetical protein
VSRRWVTAVLPIATAGLVVLVAAVLQPLTTRVWGPLMLPALALCTWLGGWRAGLLTLLVGNAGRSVAIDPPPWERPFWWFVWTSIHLIAMLIAARARQARDDREQARRVQREQVDRALRSIAARRAAFLAHASEVLASSPDYETTLAAVANLAVPQIADLCVVDIMEDNGRFKALAVAHVDPGKAQLVRELRRMYPLDPAAPFGPPRVMRTGRSVVQAELDDASGNSVDPEELRVATALGIKSTMAVPLLIGGRRLGVISFATTDSGRRFVAQDLPFAEDLARRAAIAVDAARP